MHGYGEATSAMLANRYGFAGTTNYPIDRVDLFEEEYGWTPASHSTGGDLHEHDLEVIADSVTYGGLLSRIGDTLKAGVERRQERREDRRDRWKGDVQEGWEGVKHVLTPEEQSYAEASAMPGLALPELQQPQQPQQPIPPHMRRKMLPKHQRPPKHRQPPKHQRPGKHQQADTRRQDHRVQTQHHSRQRAAHDQQGRRDHQAQSAHRRQQQLRHRG